MKNSLNRLLQAQRSVRHTRFGKAGAAASRNSLTDELRGVLKKELLALI